MQTASIVSIGTELTLGQTVDTNSAWIAARLAALGVRAERHVTVPDELLPICEALTSAAQASDVLIVTGGLGPTDDDLTRVALATASGEALVFDAAGFEQIRAYFAQRNRRMPEPNRAQAMRPRGAAAIANTCGTAPGLAMTLLGRPCFALPGVPFEMKAMFDRDVAPALAAAARGGVLRTCTIRTFGMGESAIGERLADLMQRGRNPELGTTAALGIISVRINATAATRERADALLTHTRQVVESRLGAVVFGYGEDTLSSAVGRLLADKRMTVSTAESCTGGLIAKELTDIPGSSAYMLGGVVCYSNEAKRALVGVEEGMLAEHGAVSAPVASALAQGCRARFDSDLAISVTGVAGPGGGSVEKPVGLVYIGLATRDAVTVHEQRFGQLPRDVIRLRTAHVALNSVRLTLARDNNVIAPAEPYSAAQNRP